MQEGPCARFLAQLGLDVVYVVDREQARQAVAAILQADAADAPYGLDIETALVPELRTQLHGLLAQGKLPSRARRDTNIKKQIELIRSFGLNPESSRIRLVQVFAGSTDAYVFDIDRIGLDPLRPLWTLPLVAHNATFEQKHLAHAGHFLADLHCTRLAEHAVTGHPRSLAELAKLLVRWTLSKEMQTSDWGAPDLTAEQIAYAAVDAVAVWKCWRIISTDPAFQRACDIYELERKAIPAVVMMETAGVALDVGAHERLVQSLSTEQAKALSELRLLLGEGINANSTKQRSQALAPLVPANWPLTKQRYLATERKVLLRYIDIPAVQRLLAFRKANYLVSNFGSTLRTKVNPVSRRLHASYNIAAAKTGRLQTSQPNVQGMPSKSDQRVRSVIVPAPGYEFVVGDYSQIELRVAAVLSGDETMMRAYEAGEDLHKLTAAAITGKPVEEITPEEREHGKRVNFGSVYGQQAAGLREKLFTDFSKVVTEREAQAYLDAFLSRYPQLSSYLNAVSTTAMARGYSVTRSGRHRWYTNERGTAFSSPDAPARNLSRVNQEPDCWSRPVAVNTPVQGTAADVNLRALARVHAAIADTPARIVLNAHDEIVLECPEEFSPTAGQILRREMLQAFLDILPDGVQVTRDLVEVTTGKSWAECG